MGAIFRPGSEALTACQEAALDRMRRFMEPRGPDGSGVVTRGRVGLVHTRLAIIDPRERSNQPMESEDWILSYNGEIYNFQTLKAELSADCAFRTGSDTEVLLMGLQHWGLDRTLERCAGMFAFLAWNKREGCLYAVRDRMGIKPLCMGLLDDGSYCFASSAAAIVDAFPDMDWPLFKPALASFFALGAPFTRTTVFDGIERVGPARYVRCLPDGTFETVKYWEPRQRPGFTMDDLVEVVREHQVSDVKSALFLSGGVDSSFLCAATSDLDCFHLASPETHYAEAAARAFGRTLVTVEPKTADFEADAAEVIRLHGEPLMSGGIPFSVARSVREHGYKMAISANGADELFHGYPRTPTPGFTPDYLPLHEQRTYHFLNQQLAHIFRDRRHFSIPELDEYIPSLREIGDAALAGLTLTDFPESANHRWLELMTYVLFDLNPTLDAASMATGVEVRVPFLDHRIVEGVLSWPVEELITPRYGRKSPLKEYLARYLPPAFFNRPKLGFSVSEETLGGIARLGADALARAEAAGFVGPGSDEFDEFRRDRAYLGNCCLAYDQWLEHFGDRGLSHA